MKEEVAVGGNALRAMVDSSGGFFHVALQNADDGDVIVVNEDDLQALRDFIDKVLEAKHDGERRGASVMGNDRVDGPGLKVLRAFKAHLDRMKAANDAVGGGADYECGYQDALQEVLRLLDTLTLLVE